MTGASIRARAPAATSRGVRSRMQAVPRRDTKPELALRSALHRRGLRYRVGARPIPDLRRTADALFPRARVAVFVDGCFWHGCPEHCEWPATNAAWWREKIAATVDRDRHTDARLRDAGWLPIRVWEHDDPACAAEAVERAVRAQRLSAGSTTSTSPRTATTS